MKIFQVVVFVLTIINVICTEKDKRTTNEEVQNVSLNRGEYFPYEDELKEYDTQYGYKVKNNGYYSPEQQEQEGTQFMIIKRTKEAPIIKKLVIANPIIASQVPTKIMPVKVIQEGPVKHVYLPQYYSDQSSQIKSSSRSSKTYENFNQASYKPQYHFNGYNPGHQQNYFRPSVQYQFLQPVVSGIGQGIYKNGYNTALSGYRSGKSNDFVPLKLKYENNVYPNGFESNLYNIGSQYVPQGYSGYSSGASKFVSTVPSYQNGYPYQQMLQIGVDSKPKYSFGVSSQYKSGVSSNQYSQPQTYTVTNNLAQIQQSYDFGREPKLAQLSNQYKSLVSGVSDNNAYFTKQYGQSQRYTSALANNVASNQQSDDLGKEANLAHQSDQYKSLVSDGSGNNDYFTNQYGQSQGYISPLSNNVANNQQSDISGQEVNLAQQSDQYKSLVSGESGNNPNFIDQYDQSQGFTSTLANNVVNNQQSDNSGQEANLAQQSDQYKSLVSGASGNNAYFTNQYSPSQGYTSTLANNVVNNQQSDNAGQEVNLAQQSDQYKSLVSGASGNNAYFTNQYSPSQRYTSTLANNVANNQQSDSSGKEVKLDEGSGLDPELAKIVNDVLNNGKGYPTHEGFTVIKSKTDKAIYLIGKPGMSLGTMPNFSSYNYASFQKNEEPAETKTEEKKTT